MVLYNPVGFVVRLASWRPKARRLPSGPVLLVAMLAFWLVAAPAPHPLWGQALAVAEAAEEEVAEEPVDLGHPLYVMNADGTGLRRLITMPDYTSHGSPEWCTDGTKIAFDAWRPAKGEDYGEANIIVANSDGSSPKNLGPGAMPSLSPHGNRIVFSQYDPRGVWVMYADGSGRRVLDPEGWGAQWSPDGRMLAWTIRDEGAANIRLYDLIEGQLRTVLEGDHRRYRSIYWGFDFSPDGKRLCFKGTTSDGQEELAIVSVEGSSKGFNVRLKEKMGSNLAWSPDGKQILMNKWCNQRKRQQVYVLDVDSDEPAKLLEGQDPQRSNTSAEWSPDGKKIIFTSGQK